MLRIDRDAAYADEALHSRRMNRLCASDRGIVTEMVMGSLRRRGELDHLLARRLQGPLSRLDVEVLSVLRLGAYQVRHMQAVPQHAAVFESVELVKWARKGSAAGLVNAVLRRLPPSPPADAAARLCHPAWLVRRWDHSLGQSACNALLHSNLERPHSYFRIPASVPIGRVLRRLDQAGIHVKPAGVTRAYQLLSGNATKARRAAGVPLQFQDINAQRVGHLVDVRPGSTVLDVCAAPGGKARLLAESGRVIGGDRHMHRLRTLQRLGSRGIDPVALDAERALPFSRRFDRVLVDAPCSGTGTLARNPDIKWRLRPRDIQALHARQARILDNTLKVLAPGGMLVYATCSLEPEENVDVIEAAIRNRPGWKARRVLSTVPGRDLGDGFQAWCVHRPAT